MMEAFPVLHDVRILIDDAVVHHMQHLASRTSVGDTQWHALYAASTCPWCSSEHVVHTSIELGHRGRASVTASHALAMPGEPAGRAADQLDGGHDGPDQWARWWAEMATDRPLRGHTGHGHSEFSYRVHARNVTRLSRGGCAQTRSHVRRFISRFIGIARRRVRSVIAPVRRPLASQNACRTFGGPDPPSPGAPWACAHSNRTLISEIDKSVTPPCFTAEGLSYPNPSGMHEG